MPLIKCKFCNWTHKRYYKNKRGKLVDGYKALLHHTECCHDDQYMEIVSALEQDRIDKEGWIECEHG